MKVCWTTVLSAVSLSHVSTLSPMRQDGSGGSQALAIKVKPRMTSKGSQIERTGKHFPREWVRSVGKEAKALFVPGYFAS